MQILLLAKLAGVLKLGNLSLDGSKIHADASKSHAISYQRLVELEAQLRTEVQELLTLPDSRIMKNSTDDGFDQPYNVQAAVDQDSLLIVAPSLSNHPNDQREVEPMLDALPPQLGQPHAAALDNGYFSEANIHALEQWGIDPYIATGREPHPKGLWSFFDERPEPPPETANLKEQMAYKLRTGIGQTIYRLRKCTVEPVIGIIKEILGFANSPCGAGWQRRASGVGSA